MKIFDWTKKGLKLVTMVGNSMLVGAVGALGVFSVPTISIPIKICTAVSSYILTGVVTEKTDAYIDKTIDELQEELDEMNKDISQ